MPWLMVGDKMRIGYDSSTGERGTQIKLANGTGVASVKGTLLMADTNADDSFDLLAADGVDPTHVVYEAGIVDASEAWVWCEGSHCQGLLEDGTAATHGNWCRGSTTVAGRIVMNTTVPAPPTNATHFAECGHCQQTVGDGTDVLALFDLHTN